MAIIADIDHETGDLSEYDSTVTDGGDLSVTTAAALAGTGYGLNCLVDDTNEIYGKVNISASKYLGGRFHFSTVDYVPVVGDAFRMMEIGLSAFPWYMVYIEHFFNSEGHHIRAQVRSDVTTHYGTVWPMSDGEHWVEWLMDKAGTSSSSDGTVDLWLDNVHKEQIAGIDNFTNYAKINGALLGACGLAVGASGTLFLDQFILRNDAVWIGGHAEPARQPAAYFDGPAIF